MAKFVCDYAQVTSAGDKIIEVANDYATEAAKYDNNIKQDLSNWQGGSAKGNFAYQSDGATRVVASKIIRMAELGEFVKQAAKSIEELDDQLAAIKI